MKKTIAILAVLMMAAPAMADKSGKKVFEVTVTNLTKGQPITPPVIAVHAPGYELVKLGEEASEGLGQLAKDGVTATLDKELTYNMNVVRTVVGEGVILPGQSQKLEVEANDSRFKLSLVGMLARTNDAIVIAKSLNTRLRKGQSYSVLAKVYDAGVEDNTESCEHIPAPPCGSPMVDAGEGEGFVHPHPGIQNIGDLEALRDTFADTVAKIKVKRIK